MENTTQTQERTNSSIYYIVGVFILILIIAVGYALRPKTKDQNTTQKASAPAAPMPTPGPIMGLSCELQYYNPVVALPQYYLSVEGVDKPPAATVTCSFDVSVNGEMVTKEEIKGLVDQAPERGGFTYRCTTQALSLDAGIPTDIAVNITDDTGNTTTCSATFILPAP